MGLAQTIRTFLAPSDQHSILDPRSRRNNSLLLQLTDPDSLAEAHQFDRLAREGYRLHSVVRACIDELVSSAAEPEFIVEEYAGNNRWEKVNPLEGRGKGSNARELAKLMMNPGGLTEGRVIPRYEWFERFLTEYSIYGNAMAHKVRGATSGMCKQLELLRVPWIEPDRAQIGDEVRTVTVRKYLTKDIVAPQGTATSIRIQDLLHSRTIDPLDDFWGLPAMASCLEDIDLDQKAHLYLRTFFYNAGTPQGLLKLKGVANQDQRTKLQQQWGERYSGQGAHRLAVLDQDAEYQELGTRPDKLKLDHIFDVTESRICATYHVPPGLVAVRIGLMRNTFSNAKEQRRSFWHETLRPMYVKLGDLFTASLAWEFNQDGSLRIRPDFSRVEDLQELTDSKRTWAMDGYDKGLLSHHEARANVDLPSKGEDHFKTKSADGQPFQIGEKPNPNPKPEKPVNPAARPATPARQAAAPELEERVALPASLRVVGGPNP